MPRIEAREIATVLIAGRDSGTVASLIGAREPGLTLRAVAADGVRQADVDWADALVTFIAPDGLDFEGLKWLHCTGAGLDQLFKGRDWPAGILLTRTIGQLGVQVAEYCLGHMLAARLHLRARYEAQAATAWRQEPWPDLLAGSRALVVGAGGIGGAIAALLRGNDIEVGSVARARRDDPGVMTWDQALPRLGGFDWIILAAPLTGETRRMIDKAALAQCRGAVLINVGRGELVDHDALLEALDGGLLSGAVLDVFEPEPLPPESPLWHHPKVTVTPHIAGLTMPGDAADAFVDALRRLRAGEQPDHTADPVFGY